MNTDYADMLQVPHREKANGAAGKDTKAVILVRTRTHFLPFPPRNPTILHLMDYMPIHVGAGAVMPGRLTLIFVLPGRRPVPRYAISTFVT